MRRPAESCRMTKTEGAAVLWRRGDLLMALTPPLNGGTKEQPREGWKHSRGQGAEMSSTVAERDCPPF